MDVFLFVKIILVSLNNYLTTAHVGIYSIIYILVFISYLLKYICMFIMPFVLLIFLPNTEYNEL